MKHKLILSIGILLAVIFAGCEKTSPDNNGDITGTDGKLNPPAWFIGEWEQEDHNINEDMTVTAHNVVVSSGNLDFSYQIEHEYLTDFHETLVGDKYSLSYITKHPEGTSVIYAFEPNGSNKIKRTITMSNFGTVTTNFNRK